MEMTYHMLQNEDHVTQDPFKCETGYGERSNAPNNCYARVDLNIRAKAAFNFHDATTYLSTICDIFLSPRPTLEALSY